MPLASWAAALPCRVRPGMEAAAAAPPCARLLRSACPLLFPGTAHLRLVLQVVLETNNNAQFSYPLFCHDQLIPCACVCSQAPPSKVTLPQSCQHRHWETSRWNVAGCRGYRKPEQYGPHQDLVHPPVMQRCRCPAGGTAGRANTGGKVQLSLSRGPPEPEAVLPSQGCKEIPHPKPKKVRPGDC